MLIMDNPLNILIIDKFSDITSLLADEFKQLGCNFALVEDEILALQKACEQKYDVIFCNAWIQHENSGIQVISLIRQHSEINKDTPIYALDVDEHKEFIRHPENYGLTNCIPIHHLSESLPQIHNIINNCRLIDKKAGETVKLSDSKKDFLLAKTLELVGNFHVLLIGSQSAENIIKLFSNSPGDIDVAFDYGAAKKKLALNIYDFVLIDLDATDLKSDTNLVYFAKNFCKKNLGTAIFGFSAENSDDYNKDVKACTHIPHVMKFPFKEENIEEMIRITRWKIDAVFQKYA